MSFLPVLAAVLLPIDDRTQTCTDLTVTAVLGRVRSILISAARANEYCSATNRHDATSEGQHSL